MLQHQFGTAVETVYGTPVVVDRFHEFLPGESLGRENIVLNSSGLRPGIRSMLGSRRVQTGRSATGAVAFEVATTTFGRFFENMLGGTPTIVQQAATPAWLQTHIPGDIDGKSMTLQKGVEKTDGTVQAFTYHGAKVVSWEISISKNGLCILTLDFDCEDEDTTTALASASYPTLSLFHFAQATLKKDTVALANVSDMTIRGTNPMDTDRYFLGTAGLKAEPLENDFRVISGNISAEFANITDYHAAFAGDTTLQLDLEFVGAEIDPAPEDEELFFTVYDVRLTGETPKISGPAPAVQAVPYEAFEEDAGTSIRILYQSTDTAI